jgi:putative aldouronate transport system permease protein
MLKKKLLKITTFDCINFTVLVLASMVCLLPFIHVAAVSLSKTSAVEAGRVTLVPIGMTLASYQYVLKRSEFWDALNITVIRTLLSIAVSMFFLIMTAYPLSRQGSKLKGRIAYSWFFMFTMFFNGGIIPTYMTIKELGLLDNILALVLPLTLNPFNLVILINFFKRVPEELEEAATIDGAGHLRILWTIFVPISKPAIATLVLFTAVFHWNAWFDGLIYMNQDRYPLQTYMRSVIIGRDMSTFETTNLQEMELMLKTSGRTLISTQILIGSLPIFVLYPFLQKYFVKGITIGSVKG